MEYGLSGPPEEDPGELWRRLIRLSVSLRVVLVDPAISPGQLGVELSGFFNVTADFTRMQERPSVKLLVYEKEVSERFAKTA